MAKINIAKQKMLRGEAAVGYALKLASPVAAEFLTNSGVDFLSLDTQHGSWGPDSVVPAFAAICTGPAIPMARVVYNAFHLIGQILDAGALGIVVPMVNTRAEAQAVADACHFPPLGQRSYGTGRCLAYGEDYFDWIDEQLFVAVQIESVEAVENAEAILSVPGIDGCMVGPADLALSMGFPPREQTNRDEHARALERVLLACRNTGKIPGIDTGNLDAAIRWGQAGYRYLVLGSDLRLMLGAATAGVAKARARLTG